MKGKVETNQGGLPSGTGELGRKETAHKRPINGGGMILAGLEELSEFDGRKASKSATLLGLGLV